MGKAKLGGGRAENQSAKGQHFNNMQRADGATSASQAADYEPVKSSTPVKSSNTMNTSPDTTVIFLNNKLGPGHKSDLQTEPDKLDDPVN